MIEIAFTDAKHWRWVSRTLARCSCRATNISAPNSKAEAAADSDIGATKHAKRPQGPHERRARTQSLPPTAPWEPGGEPHRQTGYDSLTGLPGRRLFMERLRQLTACTAGQSVDHAVLLLDVDDFKGINTHFGRDAGDCVLIAFAERVHARLRPTDTLARFGGDEFAILLERPGGYEGVWRVAQRLCQALRTPVCTQGLTLHCRACAGAALAYLPCHRSDDLLRQAGRALRRARRSGRACFAVV